MAVITGILVATVIAALASMAGTAVTSSFKKEANTLASDIANKMADDTNLYNKFVTANSAEQSNILTNLISSAGFGSRFQALQRAYKRSKARADKAADEHNKVQKAYNSASQHATQDVMDKSTFSTAIGAKIGGDAERNAAISNMSAANSMSSATSYATQNVKGGLK